MNFLSVLYAKAGITVDGVTTLNNTATGLTPATNDNSTKLATTGYVKNQNYYPYPTGTTSQYVRGDGSLATFTQTGGGGSSVSYYLNGGTSQGTIGGNTYYEMSKTAVVGTNVDFNINSNGYIAQFVTDAGDPALLSIPGGNWNLEMFFSASSGGGSPSFYVELYKYDGTTLTLIASNSATPEGITGGTSIDLYVTALAVPTTTLTLTDRLAVRVYVTHSGRTITLHTQDSHLCQVITTFTTGLTALNGLTAQVQNFAVGTGGSDFAISSVTDTHTFNLPTASATKRGALSSIDWSAFDAKVDFGDLSATSPLSYNGSGVFSIAQSSTSTNGYLSSTDWNTFNNKQNALTNPITGTGTTNYLPKFTGASALGNSIVSDNGSIVTVGGGITANGDITVNNLNDIVFYDTTLSAVKALINNNQLFIGTSSGTKDPGFTNFQLTNSAVSGLTDSSFAVNDQSMSMSTFVNSAASEPRMETEKARGTFLVPLPLSDGDVIGGMYFRGLGASGYKNSFMIRSTAVGAESSGVFPTETKFYNRKLGSTGGTIPEIALTIDKYNIIRSSSAFQPGRLTTTERNALTGLVGGEIIYNTTVSSLQEYSGGVWSNISSGGTVTSVDMSVPTGLSISGNPITSSGTLALTYTAGYAIPTTSSQTNWDTAYTNRITSLTTTGASGSATLISNTLNIPTYTLAGLGGVPTSAISGTSGTVALFGASNTLGDSIITQSGGGLNIAQTGANYSGINTGAKTTIGLPVVTNVNLAFGVSGAGSLGGIIQSRDNISAWYLSLNPFGGQIITANATDTGEHFIIGGSARINGTATITGAVTGSSTAQFTKLGLGNAPSATSFILSNVNLTGGTSISAWRGIFSASNDVTSRLNGVSIAVGTQASTTISDIVAYNAEGTSFGAGSSVTRVTGFSADSTLANALATNVYGFQGSIASGTNRWNLYMSGTAANYLAGNLQVGSTTTGVARAFIVGDGSLTVLRVQAATTNTPNLMELRDTTATTMFSVSGIGNTTVAGNLTVDTNTFFVDSVNNRVGVGTTSPSPGLMHLYGAAGASAVRWSEAATTVGFVGGANGLVSGKNGSFMVRGESGLVLSGQANNSNLFIDSTGDIQTASATDTGEHFIIGGSGRVNGKLTIDSNSGLSILASTSFGMNMYYDGATGYMYLDSKYNSATAGRLYIRTRTNGTPVNALWFQGTGEATFGAATYFKEGSGYNLDTALQAGMYYSAGVVYAYNNVGTWRFSTDTNSNAFELAAAGAATFSSSVTAVSLSLTTGNFTLGTSSNAGVVNMYNASTVPSASITNGVILYAQDVNPGTGASSELKVRDEAGNITTLSPHNFSLIPNGPSEELAWSYYSEKKGKKINVDMLKLARLVESLTDEQLVYIQ